MTTAPTPLDSESGIPRSSSPDDPPPPSIPKWTAFASYPVVAGTAVLAIAVGVAHGLGLDVSVLLETAHVRRGHLWRLITSALPHGGLLHLIFNVYWLWVFGTAVERVLGHTRTLLLLLLFAYGSGALEYALFTGGIGLSGVVYGLFGLLWVVSRRDGRFAHALDQRTTGLFIAWFFICIVMTVSGVYAVANTAHGVGALLGVLAGLAITDERRRRLCASAMAVVVLFGTWAATQGRPIVNLSSQGGVEECLLGYEAQKTQQHAVAAEWLRSAAAYRSMPDVCWFGLGFSENALGRPAEAIAAYRKGAERGEVFAQAELGLAYARGGDGLPRDERMAVSWYLKAAGQGSAAAQNNLAWLYVDAADPSLRNPVEALSYAQKAVASEKGSENPGYLDTLAAAFFANHRCEEAARTQQQALSLAAANEREDFQERLEKYEGAARTGACR